MSLTLTAGDLTIHRIIEQEMTFLPAQDMFPDLTSELLAENRAWLKAAKGLDDSDTLILCFQSYIVKTPHHTILIDSCIGNDKPRPTRPKWNMKTDDTYMRALKAAGLSVADIDYVMCTHLHVDHVGWNTRLENGKWVPTFPKARYVISKPDFEYFRKLDADPKDGPAELGTFRECVLPIVEAGRAELVTGPHRLNEYLDIMPAPGHSAGHVVFKLESGSSRALFIGDVLHHLIQVYHPDWNFPKNSDADQARASRRKVLEHCASIDALMMPAHVGAPFAGRIEATAKGFVPHFG